MALSLNACTFNFWFKDFETQGDKLNPPMTEQQVISTIGDPDQMSSARKKGSDFIETWEYIRVAAVPGPDQLAEREGLRQRCFGQAKMARFARLM